MDSGMLIGAVVFTATGIAIASAGYRIRRDERVDLIFSPGVDASDREVARVGGYVTVLVGVATIGLGGGTLLVSPTAEGWLFLLGPYTAVCLAIGVGCWWRLRTG